MSYPQQPQQTQPYAAQAGEPPLWAPYYGAPIGAAVKRFFKKYAAFSGRASRSEYWWVALVLGVVGFILQILTGLLGAAGSTTTSTGNVPGPGGIVGLILIFVFYLAVLIPSIALLVRRLHDGNFSGWLALLGLIPFVGGLALLVFSLLPSNPAGQRFDQPTA
ncbi:DUF805 domain-containing protein [Arthrobacter sp. StoSoilB3]|jgi:uncharacterized membrane protein YhaH (DUF805 family)|uniref:DUF805 domain-containing protein n=1 Tax=Paenarthrobacter nicotinovorans TaxID=29320 RepID=UPI00057D9B2D|nr:DUF805 domain-containing protein [Paenarthrobacter nicotinovorans]KIA74469.1 hypothetical protein ANMWB30_09130 [Arthrobacter sp. MWB30]SKC05686.1 Uncharacterized membrane protein YhaH, DUF805 family [Arthrobacter sp. 31Cvi3.1E]BCW39355.1 DUF805 domain-containing protein [Arthrobacter sp. StoSoilB3]MBP2393710.1 uncharacterized membrane protein YhaH (DUF805 family) [Paenarthrobacter nicotinovorans]UKF00044.1 DUF805 domain-containing protein [Paenarthrobacter nicotinovorans]